MFSSFETIWYNYYISSLGASFMILVANSSVIVELQAIKWPSVSLTCSSWSQFQPSSLSEETKNFLTKGGRIA